jgi:hypothetical protein
MSRFTAFAFALSVLALAPDNGRAADDVAKAAADARKQLADIQKQLAAGTDDQKRLRIDTFEAGDEIVKVVGVFIDVPAAKADDPVPFDQVRDDLFKSLRDRLKAPELKFDGAGIVRLPPEKHPHVLLQLAANAAGATDPLADQVRLDGSRFAADGALVLTGSRGKDDAVGAWLAAAIPATLGKHPAVLVKDGKSLVIEDVKPVEWKLSAAGAQKALAASADAATRRLRADRAYFTYEVVKGADGVRVSGLRYVVSGIRLGDDKLDLSAVQDTFRKLWPEALGGANAVPVTAADFSVGITEPVAKLQAAVADRPALDGVRVDAGGEFGPAGELLLAGVQPGLATAGQKELTAAYQAVLKDLSGKDDEAAARYKRLAAGPVSAKKMAVVATPKLLADLRAWAAAGIDDVRLPRLYFAADSGLRLRSQTVTRADGDRVLAKFKELVPTFLPPVPGEPSKFPDPAAEPSLFPAGLTARLRTEMAGDQKKWNGVLIERGYFDAGDRYAIRGVVDSAGQNDALGELLKALAGDGGQYGDYFAPPPAPPALEVIPMGELLDRVKRVTPAYAAFDGVRVESARYDADGNLIFQAHIVGRPDRDAAPLLAKLIRDNPKYRRRAPADRQVLLARADGPGYSDGQVGDFSIALGAKLLAKANGSKEDKAKAKEWLDVAVLNYPNEAAVWFLSAYYNFTVARDDELTRRDLYRVIDLEGPLAFNGPSQRKRRYEAARDFQGAVRNDLEALWLECFREVRDGAKPITLAAKK